MTEALLDLALYYGIILVVVLAVREVRSYDAANPLDDAYRMRAGRARYAREVEGGIIVPAFLRETSADRRSRYSRYKNLRAVE